MPPVDMPWRPIQTAPQDGTDLLGIRVDNGRQLVIRWDAGTKTWVACNTVSVKPTHWKPLPDPPGGTPTQLPAPFPEQLPSQEDE